jgi:hypothetical protein
MKIATSLETDFFNRIGRLQSLEVLSVCIIRLTASGLELLVNRRS